MKMFRYQSTILRDPQLVNYTQVFQDIYQVQSLCKSCSPAVQKKLFCSKKASKPFIGPKSLTSVLQVLKKASQLTTDDPHLKKHLTYFKLRKKTTVINQTLLNCGVCKECINTNKKRHLSLEELVFRHSNPKPFVCCNYPDGPTDY